MGIGDSMARMDKYEDERESEYSRTRKNEDLYKDVYLNNTLIDLNKIIADDIEMTEETREEVIEIKEMYYEDKNYSLKDYLEEKRRIRVADNLPRSLDQSIKENESEISELVSKIEQKEKAEDFFLDLLPDDEDTIITDPQEEKLDNFISEEAINNFVMHKDLDETNSFMDLDETQVVKTKVKNKERRKFKKLPIIVCGTSFLLLLALVIYLVIHYN